MNTANVEVAELDDLKDLKSLLSAKGPCISIYLDTSATPKANSLAWREALRQVEAKLPEHGPAAKGLLENMTDWETVAQPGKSLAVFRSADVFRVMRLDQPVQNRSVVGPHFFIRPLLSGIAAARRFYLLALSQKNVRLLFCNSRNSEEVVMPAAIATSFDTYMNTAKPDHVRNNLTSAGHSGGHTKGVVGTTDTEREDKPEYLAHFFRQIDRAVNELLRGQSDPLVLAAVEYELAQYRSLNTYPHLLDENVTGAPNGLKAGEMHARALEALQRSLQRKTEALLAEYNHKVGGGASNRLKDVVMAAHDGRVLTLLVSDSLETTGAFDESTHTVTGRPNGASEEEDLVNDAAIQTIVHGGTVFALPNNKMPNGAPLAAIFRY